MVIKKEGVNNEHEMVYEEIRKLFAVKAPNTTFLLVCKNGKCILTIFHLITKLLLTIEHKNPWEVYRVLKLLLSRTKTPATA